MTWAPRTKFQIQIPAAPAVRSKQRTSELAIDAEGRWPRAHQSQPLLCYESKLMSVEAGAGRSPVVAFRARNADRSSPQNLARTEKSLTAVYCCSERAARALEAPSTAKKNCRCIVRTAVMFSIFDLSTPNYIQRRCDTFRGLLSMVMNLIWKDISGRVSGFHDFVAS